jgi:hypothetical protein
MDDNIAQFVAVCGVTPEVAQVYMALAPGDFERAVGLYFENPDLAATAASGTAPPVPQTRPNVGREDASGVIHLDSDDDDDEMYLGNDDDDNNSNDGRVAAAHAAAIAQEEEDAAMAKRLQEELYRENHGSGSGDAMNPEDVRAPIARTTETLIAPDPSWGGGAPASMDDFFSDLAGRPPTHASGPLRTRRGGGAARSGGPFAQRIWGDASDSPSENGPHARRLQDLFRPPFDLMSDARSWDDARTEGKDEKKWIMVNLQDMSDFNCQALNRDIWKDEAVHALVAENFVFLQYEKEFNDAQEYITFYFPNQSHENPEIYPHVSIIDPRTGEQVKVWSGRPFPSAAEFHAELAEFLDRYSLAANSKNPVAKSTTRKPQTVDVDRMTEEEMLEMALKNSLAGAESSKSGSNSNVHDPDSLTKSPAPPESQDKGKELEVEASSSAQGPFSQISATNPHVEPENNPATTTRIQFRHPTGRVIRRFNLQDPVRRIYEWLKAEPLEGRENVVFELKKMPQGQDLIEGLESTIEETGLKQGTVMIEFIED